MKGFVIKKLTRGFVLFILNLQTISQEVIVVGDYEGCLPFASLVEKGSSTFNTADDICPADDVVLIPYSSGTTGLPKGVQLTHRNLISELSALRYTFRDS